MSKNIFYVKDGKGRQVPAKHLTDSSGNFIINPRTNAPYIAPASYSVADAISVGRRLRQYRLTSSDKYEKIIEIFRAGGQQDLQRSYNGKVGNSGHEFVEDFRDIASFHFGLSMRAAGVDEEISVMGGGFYNAWKKFAKGENLDTSGDWWNNPRNPPNIRMGSQIYESGRVKLDPDMEFDLFPFKELEISTGDPIAEGVYSALHNGKSRQEIANHLKTGGDLSQNGAFRRKGHPFAGNAVPQSSGPGENQTHARQQIDKSAPRRAPERPTQDHLLRKIKSEPVHLNGPIEPWNGQSIAKNPFHLDGQDLRRQAELLDTDPVLARRLIEAAGRNPSLFRL
ncbi:hypothetical protein [Roseibium sp.]|uniref:hypothetical protein n=1 Tax=Roseibium sp. TaxID=1936156 RepID=UPI003BB1103C